MQQLNNLHKMYEFAKWARIYTEKSTNFEINIYWFAHLNEQKIYYRLWVEDLVNESSENLEDLINSIPKFISVCEQYKQVAA